MAMKKQMLKLMVGDVVVVVGQWLRTADEGSKWQRAVVK